jgi:transglutaminase-like putative cysteine protease
MPSRAIRPILIVLLALALATPAGAVEPSIIIRKLAINITVGADGHATTITHREQSPASIAAASQLGQFPIGFNPSLERLDILEAYTRKIDGSRKEVDTAGIRAQLAPGVPNVPIFQDVQEKVVVFPDLGAGDTEVINYRQETERPLFEGQFLWAYEFPRTIAWLDVAITVTAPADYKLNTESFGVDFTRTEQDGSVRYAWHYRAPEVIAEDLGVIASWDRLPRLFVSSFPDYAAMGAAYAKLAEPKAAVTPRIQRRADAITAGITDRREQARVLYEWVSAHIRYVALYLAAGGVEPHDAETVLDNGYGDCKDHTVLFEALLKAKGIESHGVLLNLGTAYTLSGPPTMAQLDHVISYLPEFDVYADTTSGVAPFGMLPFQEYGKPAVLATEAGGAASVRQLPMLAPDAATIAVRTEAHIDLDGAVIGTTTTTATGPAAIALRLMARSVQTMGHEGAARRQLVALGQTGTGVFQFAPPDTFEPSYAVSGRFTLDPEPEIFDGDSFAPPLGLPLLVRPGDYLLGPLRRPTLADSEPTPCFPGRQTEDLSLELPQGRAPQRLPPDRKIETGWFSYLSHWSMAGQTVRVHRELVSRIDHPVCADAERHEAAAALRDIRRDEQAKVALALR